MAMLMSNKMWETVEEARVAVQLAHDAANGVLCGTYQIDKDRLAEADRRMEAANAAYRDGNVCAVEAEINWALHYAQTCGI